MLDKLQRKNTSFLQKAVDTEKAFINDANGRAHESSEKEKRIKT